MLYFSRQRMPATHLLEDERRGGRVAGFHACLQHPAGALLPRHGHHLALQLPHWTSPLPASSSSTTTTTSAAVATGVAVVLLVLVLAVAVVVVRVEGLLGLRRAVVVLLRLLRLVGIRTIRLLPSIASACRPGP